LGVSVGGGVVICNKQKGSQSLCEFFSVDFQGVADRFFKNHNSCRDSEEEAEVPVLCEPFLALIVGGGQYPVFESGELSVEEAGLVAGGS